MAAPSQPYSLHAGVELGGTKCIATLARGPEILAQETVATTSPDETLGSIERTLRRWWDEERFAALGVASFGPVDLDRSSSTYGSITTTAKVRWCGTDVLKRVAARFPIPVAFDTDVNGAALGELLWGAGRGLSDFAYITVGTGVGVGLIVNGAPVHGFGHPEIGHVRVARLPGDDWPGACPFHGGCVEGLASGSAIEARLAGRPVADLAAGDPIWRSVAHAIAQLCHTLVCATAPQRIVVGGGVMSRQPHLLPMVQQMLEESLAGYLPLPGEGAYVRAPGLGDRAGPLGSIALAMAAADEA
jgi:fructokinase